jgi:hypothetical protein
MDEEQPAFDFMDEPWPPARHPSPHPVIEMRWKNGGVECYWPEFNLVSWMGSWQNALDLALHPNNRHVSVRVKT